MITATIRRCGLLAALALPLGVAEAAAIAVGEGHSDSRPGREANVRLPADAGLSLRLSSELSAVAPDSDLGRGLRRLEYRTLQMLAARKDDPQVLGDKLAWLEADLAELKRAGDRLGGVAAAMPTPSPATPATPASASTPATPAKLSANPGVAPASTVVVPTASPASQMLPGGTTAKAVPRQAATASEKAFTDRMHYEYAGLAGLTGLGAMALLLALLVFRRRLFARPTRLSRRRAEPVPEVSEADFSRTPAEALALPGKFPAPARAWVQQQAPDRTEFLSQAPANVPADVEQGGAGPALELAEIMLSFGRVGGAAKTLHEYIEANPKEALRPWIRLLQIYQDNDLREEFEALATKLNRNFNVEIMRWSGGQHRDELELLPLGQTTEKVVTLEQLPHLREKVVSLWSKPGCRDYLEQLLRDNREGQRSGFTLPVVEELLFLIDLITACEAEQQANE